MVSVCKCDAIERDVLNHVCVDQDTIKLNGGAVRMENGRGEAGHDPIIALARNPCHLWERLPNRTI